jgi:hypothetical protein
MMSKSPAAADRLPLQLVPQRRFAPIEWAGDVKEAPPGGAITVDLGGEVMRCPVRRVIDEDAVLLELTGVPMSRNHPFKPGEFLGARRHRGIGGRDEWKAVDPRIVSEIETRKLAEERRARSEAKPAAPAKRRGVMARSEEK